MYNDKTNIYIIIYLFISNEKKNSLLLDYTFLSLAMKNKQFIDQPLQTKNEQFTA